MWNRHIPSNNCDIAIILELEALLNIKPVTPKTESAALDKGISLHPDIIWLLKEFLHTGLPITLITGYKLSKAKHILGNSLKSLSVIASYGAEMEISKAFSKGLGRNAAPSSGVLKKVQGQLSNVENTYPEARYELTRTGTKISSATEPQKLDEIYSELIAMASKWGNDFRLIRSEGALELSPQSNAKPNNNYGVAIAKLMSHRKLRPLKPCFIGSSIAAETGFLMSNILDGISINLNGTDNSHAKFQISHQNSVMNSLITLLSVENITTKNELIFNLDLVAA